MRLAVLRPEPGGESTAEALRRIGHAVMVAPLLRMMPLPAAELNGPWAAILLTSANAARAVATHPAFPDLLRLRVLAVGDRTADSARAAGFVDVVSAAGDAGDLAALVTAQFHTATTPLLHLAGEERAFDFKAALAPGGIAVETRAIYRMEPERQFAADFADALLRGAIDAVLHYSPRSATTYLHCAGDADLRCAALAPLQLCLSEQVAAPIVAAGAAHVRVARQPDEASLFRLLHAD